MALNDRDRLFEVLVEFGVVRELRSATKLIIQQDQAALTGSSIEPQRLVTVRIAVRGQLREV